MRRAALALAALAALALAACGSATARPAAAPAAAGPARRACVHADEPVPASCIRRSARGKLLLDDHGAALRVWQACDAGGVIDGSYVAEKVGNGKDDHAQLAALLNAKQRDVRTIGMTTIELGACGGDGTGDDAGCIAVGFASPNEDVPAAARDLAQVFATDEDLCVPFRIDTGAGGAAASR